MLVRALVRTTSDLPGQGVEQIRVTARHVRKGLSFEDINEHTEIFCFSPIDWFTSTGSTSVLSTCLQRLKIDTLLSTKDVSPSSCTTRLTSSISCDEILVGERREASLAIHSSTGSCIDAIRELVKHGLHNPQDTNLEKHVMSSLTNIALKRPRKRTRKP